VRIVAASSGALNATVLARGVCAGDVAGATSKLVDLWKTEATLASAFDVNLADVVRLARTSRRSFYEHFEDRDACFLALFDATNDAMMRRVAENVDPARSLDVQVDAAAQMDGAGQERAGGHYHVAAARAAGVVDRGGEGDGVHRGAVAHRAEISDAEVPPREPRAAHRGDDPVGGGVSRRPCRPDGRAGSPRDAGGGHGAGGGG